ncbi:MAG TPA: hypothetical protein VGL77_14435, partial [Armatimonadota bacterium]
KLPVGFLVNLISRLAHSPRITGGIYLEEGQPMLVAHLISDGPTRSWRVGPPVDSDGQPLEVSMLSMIYQLACQIFADLVYNGNIRWEAVQEFNDGLAAYYESLHTPPQRTHKLNVAMLKFTEAAMRDESFSLAYYNIGILHLEKAVSEKDNLDLNALEAAEQAFKQALLRDASDWSSRYGLALVYWERALELQRAEDQLPGDAQDAVTNIRRQRQRFYEFILTVCDQIIATVPLYEAACVYSLKGATLRRNATEGPGTTSTEAEWVMFAKLGAFAAWYRLCALQLCKAWEPAYHAKRKERTDTASECLHNLGVIYAYCADPDIAKETLGILEGENTLPAIVPWNRQQLQAFTKARLFMEWAYGLTPCEKTVCLQLGRLYYRRDKKLFPLASAMFRHAISIDPSYVSPHAYLGLLYARQQYDNAVAAGRAHLTRLAGDHLLRASTLLGEKTSKKLFATIALGYLLLGMPEQLEQVRMMWKLQCAAVPEMIRLLKSLTPTKHCLTYAYGTSLLAQRVLTRAEADGGNVKMPLAIVANLLKRAASSAKAYHEIDFTNFHLRALLARLLVAQGKYTEALQTAQAEYQKNPRCLDTLTALAQAYTALHVKDKARRAWENLLRLDTDNGELCYQFAHYLLKEAVNEYGIVVNRRELHYAQRRFKEADELLEDRPNCLRHATAHYWQGYICLLLHDDAQAIIHLHTAREVITDHPLIHLNLGYAYLRNHRHAESHRSLQDAAQAVATLATRGKQDTGGALEERLSLSEARVRIAIYQSNLQQESDTASPSPEALLNTAQGDISVSGLASSRKAYLQALLTASRGRLAFHKADFPQAITMFEAAVAAVPLLDTCTELVRAYQGYMAQPENDKRVPVYAARLGTCSTCLSVRDPRCDADTDHTINCPIIRHPSYN